MHYSDSVSPAPFSVADEACPSGLLSFAVLSSAVALFSGSVAASVSSGYPVIVSVSFSSEISSKTSKTVCVSVPTFCSSVT